jgi:8-oxo-dGTP diphosphatase
MERPIIQFYETDNSRYNYNYVVIVALYNEAWIWVKLHTRDTWELPAGHVEQNETLEEAACRELMEETGAEEFIISPLCDFTIETSNESSRSRLFFAKVSKLGKLPNSEVEKINLYKRAPKNLTYNQIQSTLFRKALKIIALEKESEL